MAKQKTKQKTDRPARRYGVMYWFDGRKVNDPNAWGATEKLINACGNAAKHVSRSEMDGKEYRRAIIWDRWTGNFVRVYNSTADGISIIKYKNGEKIEEKKSRSAEIIQFKKAV